MEPSALALWRSRRRSSMVISGSSLMVAHRKPPRCGTTSGSASATQGRRPALGVGLRDGRDRPCPCEGGIALETDSQGVVSHGARRARPGAALSERRIGGVLGQRLRHDGPDRRARQSGRHRQELPARRPRQNRPRHDIGEHLPRRFTSIPFVTLKPRDACYGT